MIDESLKRKIIPWAERSIGVSWTALGRHPVPVVRPEWNPEIGLPVVAVRSDELAAVVAPAELVEKIRSRVQSLHADQIFSQFGSYELSRVTLPMGISVWGPTWNLFSDKPPEMSPAGNRVEELSQTEFLKVNFTLFWHCDPGAQVGFALRDGDELTALATATDRGDPVWEIGMEVAPNAKGQGLGRAVVTAAVNWILANGKIALAKVGPFNVPSARTLRSVGMQYGFTIMEGKREPFMIPPQTLGSPQRDTVLYNSYPDWAMNGDILPKPGP